MTLWGNKDTVYSTGNVTTISAAGVITEMALPGIQVMVLFLV